MVKTETKIPDTSQAEQWIDPDTFLFKQKLYRVKSDGTVVKVSKATESSRTK